MIQAVYYIDDNYIEDKVLNPIAIRPNIFGNILRWEDTERGSYLNFDRISYEPDNIDINKTTPSAIVLSCKGHETRLEFLTKKIFDEQLKLRVAGGKQLNFTNDSEIQNFYLSTNFFI